MSLEAAELRRQEQMLLVCKENLQAAAEKAEALRDGIRQAWRSEETTYLLQALEKLGCRTYASQANYIFFRGETTLGEKLRAAGFLVRDCSNYAGLGKGYYRVAVRLHEDNVKLVQALAHILD